MVSRATVSNASKEEVRRYIETTYCGRFERNGWVYEDGALNIAVQKWLQESETCATASAGEPARTVPCQETGPIECALLHHVRRSEVKAYIEELQRKGEVRCDDGTSVEELGVP